MEIPLLSDIVVIFGLAVAVLYICNKIGIPAIVGFLFTGIICGPHGLGWVGDLSAVDMLAEVGIVLLLFTIGLEFSFSKLFELKRYFLIGGLLQAGLTIAISFGVAQLLNRPFGESIFLGFLLSLSSTAIVLKSYEKKDGTDTPDGRLSMGILIFQDVIAVPMMLFVPALSGSDEGFDTAFLYQFFTGMLVVAGVCFGAIKIIPTVLFQVVRTRSRELFTLSVFTICFAVAWLSSSIGLSLAIGAFLAGLIISESDYRHEAMGNVMPLQDIFSSLFFVSIGMLLDIRFVLAQPFTILCVTLGVMVMKGVVVGFTAWVLGLPFRVMVLAGLALCQVGEFAFVLARAGIDHNLATDYYHQLFLAVALLTMALTPSCIDWSSRIVQMLFKLPLPKRWKTGLIEVPEEHKEKHENHVVIIGFGIAGRSLARAAKEASIQYVALEMNPETVKREKAHGEPIHFGDATHESVLDMLHVREAKSIAVMINDKEAARRIVALARRMNPNAYIIVRARYAQEMQIMRQLGANDIIPDEYGTSIEMFVHVLREHQVSPEHIEKLVHETRSMQKLSPA